MKTVGLLALGGAMGLKFEDLTYDNLRASFSKAVPKVYGNKNLDTAVIGNDYLPFYKWCDTKGDGSVALFESARCGSKSGFWYPSQVGWFDWATYATSISLEFAQIMIKYVDSIDRDHSMTLDQSEFAWHYAAMTHASAEAAFDLLDKNKDGKLTGDEFKLWSQFTKRGVDVSLPKTGNHNQLFATCGMTDSATKDQVTMYISKLMVQFLVEYEDSYDINVPEFSWPKIRASYNGHADEVYGGNIDLKATIFNEDADAYFAWCDSNGDGQVSLYESASCGSKSAFWGPEGETMTSWTDMFTYGTEIAYDFVNIMLKHYKNLDLDGSGSLNKEEFRISYAKMALLSAYVEMDILDTNNDGILQGNELKTFTTLTVRGANVCLPGTKDVFNLVTKMHSQSGITNVADVYNLSKYNSRIMAAFLPEYENVEL
jgi:hypothetical protein